MPNGQALATVFHGSDFEDMLTSAVLARFADGQEPHGCTFSLEGVADVDALVPLGEVERSASHEGGRRVLVRFEGCTVLLERFASGYVWVTITGPTMEAVGKAAAAVRSNAPVLDKVDTAVKIEFWSGSGGRLQKYVRRIDAPPWSEVAGNYPGPVAAKTGELMGLRRPAGQGRLILWHGPPGTGKTTAARALAREWSEWCRTLFVVDADELFARGWYLNALVLSGEQPSDDEASPWRLLIIEDADELLRADAKRAAGQAMSRLLNLADGFLGQGLELLILLSTNEPIGRLHPAVTRPGRCLAETEFRRFTRAEAAAWLGRVPSGLAPDFSLAELYHQRGDVSTIGGAGADPAGSRAPGMYL